ncbi:Glycosyltransferase, catalytic subunit of cellulose synthase and poly-beta-1,6-N-acetylglucosamine synthase [Granulicella rosea]|uniref:Glycosyltransferase, catalytic subunit of cellulose synthase and poly-beta-1,6-N-acetylglucosamine synthase n=1 Tax=Granulicella rosea TaxID=474952 RepID=A0A239IWQ0_9BACT|nr:glycosyltransferase [Granulicella rosea]SNS98047.1 Glycosyltransferase, catalytic subunit of cellulose synthase and poly-beta-1,6-N-acetylglucosamine synthase [Granulicella rosea]
MSDNAEELELETGGPALELTVIVPARNEEESLAACLQSLVAQSEPGFALGTEWELIVVDDHSTDRTRAIAEGFAGVTVLAAPELLTGERGGFTGKNNACWAGAQAAHGSVLLFTDADTIHEMGDLSRARRELVKYEASLLSYSPRQLTTGLAQRVVMPLVFAELSKAYPMKKVNDPNSSIAAANGQFLMVTEEAYFAVGGHRAVGMQVLEDVELARRIKRAKREIRFRYAPDALSTRMYRTTGEMIEGWTKNLALLFPFPLVMAASFTLMLLLMVALPLLALGPVLPNSWQRVAIWIVWLRGMWGFYTRAAKSNFPAGDVALSVLGMPLMIYLLVQSYVQVKVKKAVEWKGRSYPTGR